MTSTKSQRNLPSLTGKHVHIIVVKILIVFGFVFKTRIKFCVTTPSRDQGKKRRRHRGGGKRNGAEGQREEKHFPIALI